ncbi:hypothetical protein M885DRAFT_454414, partial [Pelagophyceae sp. CCMP2097]
CSLCAQTGHVMEGCPHSLCSRCLRKGHGPRDCRHKAVKLPEICTACGKYGHTWKWCEETDGDKRLADGAKCIICAERGHLDCSKTQKPPRTPDVYCAWCARNGHTEPSCPARSSARSSQQR